MSVGYNVAMRSTDLTFYFVKKLTSILEFPGTLRQTKLGKNTFQVAIIRENDGDSSFSSCHNVFQFLYNAK